MAGNGWKLPTDDSLNHVSGSSSYEQTIMADSSIIFQMTLSGCAGLLDFQIIWIELMKH